MGVDDNIDFKDIDRDIWIRKTRLMYPEVEDWVIEMAVDAWIKTKGEALEFDEETLAKAQKTRDEMFQGLEYKTEY